MKRNSKRLKKEKRMIKRLKKERLFLILCEILEKKKLPIPPKKSQLEKNIPVVNSFP